MNRVKEQLKNVLEDEQRFTIECESKVFEKIERNQNRKVGWKVPAVFISIIAICFLFILTIPKPTEEQSLTPPFDAIVIDESYNMIVNLYNTWSDNDALLAYTKKDQPSIVVTKYFVLENGKWVQKYATTQNLEMDINWVNNGQLYSGITYDQTVEEIMLDGKIVIKADEEYYQYWVGLADSSIAQVKFVYEDGTVERVSSKYVFNKHTLDFVPAAQINQLAGTELMQYKYDNMDLGDHHYTKFPLVIQPNVEEFERGEVIRYVNSDGEIVISRIVGLPHELFSISNGTVLINHIPLEMGMGYAKMNGFSTYEAYEKANEDNDVSLEGAKAIFTMDMEELKIGENQFVVIPDNWWRGSIELINLSMVKGKVLGYDPFALTDEWSSNEIALYEDFRKDYNIDRLIDVEPATIARLYWYVSLIGDVETQYELLTSREEYVLWSLEEHITMSMQQDSVNPDYYIDFARRLKEGEWVQTDENSGYIHFEKDGMTAGFQLIRAENGAWQAAFMPIQ